MGIRFLPLFCLTVLLFLSFKIKAQTTATSQKYLLKSGGVATLFANANQANSFTWYKNNTPLPGETTGTLVVKESGIYKVVAESLGGCSSTPVVIEIIDEKTLSADVAIIKRSENREVLNNQIFSYYLNVRNNGANNADNLDITDILPDNLLYESMVAPSDGTAVYDANQHQIKWQIPLMRAAHFAELEVKVRAKQPGLVINTATVKATQFDPDLKNNTSTDNKKISALHVYNVFTPNGDGKNDTFFIENLNSFEFNELTVINRYGGTVYQKKGYKNNWDGSGLSEGTYFYVISVRNGTSPWIEQKGYIVLIK